jgi:O-antigen/teichoic acid export membrane protein
MVLLPITSLIKTLAASMRGYGKVSLSLVLELVIQPSLLLVFLFIMFYGWTKFRAPHYAMWLQVSVALLMLVLARVMLAKFVREKRISQSTTFYTKTWLSSAVPFILIGGAGVLNSQTDVLMLGWMRSDGEVGVYRVSVQGAALVIFGLQALNAIVAPQFSRFYAVGDKKRLEKLAIVSSRMAIVIALPMTVAFVVAGGDIAAWVFGEEFVSSHIPLAVLAMGQLFSAAVGPVGFLLNMTGHEKDVAKMLGVTAVVNIALNFLMIPQYGNVGAAAATSFSLIFWNFALLALVRKHLNIRCAVL